MCINGYSTFTVLSISMVEPLIIEIFTKTWILSDGRDDMK